MFGCHIFMLFAVMACFSRGKIYHDFKGFNPGETLDYGILPMTNILMNPSLISTPPPNFNLFLVDAVLDTYLVERNLSFNQLSGLNLHDRGLYNSTVRVLRKQSPNISQKGDIVFIKCFNTTHVLGSKARAFNSLHFVGVVPGCIWKYDFFKIIDIGNLYDIKSSSMMENIMVTVEISEPSIYDYNNFTITFNKVLQNIQKLKSGSYFEVIILMDVIVTQFIFQHNYGLIECRQYALMLQKFLYRWGEDKKIKVVIGEETEVLAKIKFFSLHNNWTDRFQRLLRFPDESIPMVVSNTTGLLWEIVADSLIFYQSWGNNFNIIEDMPNVLNHFYHSHTDKSTRHTSIFIEGHLNPIGTVNCYDFKTYWNILRNWASVHLLRESYIIHTNSTKLTDTIKDGFFMTLNGSCAVVSDIASPQLHALDKTLSAITFKYKYVIKTLPIQELAYMLQVVHQKFDMVEVAFKQTESTNMDTAAVNTMVDAILALKKSWPISLAGSATFKYYFDFGSWELTNESIIAINKQIYQQCIGVHVNAFEALANKTFEAVKTLKSIFSEVGMTFFIYDSKSIMYLTNKILRQQLDMLSYIVVEFNLVKLFVQENHTDFKFIISTKMHGKYIEPSSYLYGYFQNNADVLHSFWATVTRVQSLLKKQLPHVKIYVRLALPSGNHTDTMNGFLRVWEFFQEATSLHEIPYIFYEAFDSEDSLMQFGWWKRKNISNGFSEPGNLVDKQAEFLGQKTTQPIRWWKTTNTVENGHKLHVIEIVAGSTFGLVLVLIVFFVLLWRIWRQNLTLFTNKDLKDYSMCQISPALTIYKEEFNKDASDVIGSGSTSVVYKTFLARYNRLVAIKTPREKNKDVVLCYLREINALLHLQEHDNIITLLGAYTMEICSGFLFIATEYCEHGSLLEHLEERRYANKNTPSLNFYELCRFCKEISEAMDYLAGRRVIHGDVAARNVLLGRYYACKICDFGLSKKITNDEVYVQTEIQSLPWAWAALETLQTSEISLKSDVWSMGVTFWEILTLGKRPFDECGFDEDFTSRIQKGFRLFPMGHAKDDIYTELEKCWNKNPQERPHPSHFVEYFNELLHNEFDIVL